jgi:[ribosomal protein S5]-alanine N-acetyltransferase
MILRTPRLTLRPVAVSDAEALFAGRGDAEVMRYWDWPAQASAAAVREVLETHIPEPGDPTMLWWAVALAPDGPAIGECDLSEIDRHNRRAEVGFLFARAHWGRGYAFEAMERVVAYAFDELGLERLWARFHAGNEASQRLLERLGFSHEGLLRGHVVRDGERRDCAVYGRLRNRSATKNGA